MLEYHVFSSPLNISAHDSFVRNYSKSQKVFIQLKYLDVIRGMNLFTEISSIKEYSRNNGGVKLFTTMQKRKNKLRQN